MGLDSVELVMEFEDEFGIQIPDPDAEAMRTIGDVVHFIAARLHASSNSAAVQDVRRRVCVIVAGQMNVKLEDLSDTTRFVEDLNVD